MKTKHKRIENLWLFDLAAHFLAIVVAYYATWLIRFQSGWGVRFFDGFNQLIGVNRSGDLGLLLKSFYITSAARIVLMLTISICIIYSLRGLYSGRSFLRKRSFVWNVVVSNLIALVLYYVYFYLSRNTWHPRSMFATLIVLNMILCVVFTSLKDALLRYLRSTLEVDRCHAILIGNSAEAEYVNSLVEVLHPHGISIDERVKLEKGESFEGLVERVSNIVKKGKLDMIISSDKRFSVSDIMKMLEVGEKLNVPVKVLSDKMNILTGPARVNSDIIKGVPLVHFNAPGKGGFAGLRYSVSVLSAYICLVLLLPLLCLIALLIKATSRGPVLFIQERIGVNRKQFQMYKFRTMYSKADEDQAQMEEFNESGEGLFKIRKDPRVTPVGRFLRRFSLDELPQLINVICGDMRIVGPRPLPRRDYNNYYEQWHYSRHGGLPGLTCLWQVSGRSDIDFHNMCILDCYYLRNHNWILDLKIVLRTVMVVVSGRGAY